jgi:hypothetical protein
MATAANSHVKTNGRASSLTAPLTKVFSFPVMCMFLLSAVIFAYAPRGIGIAEPDIWWRLRSAADFMQHPSFSSADTYSFTAAGSPWNNFEWASDLSFFLAFKTMGLQGMVVVYSLAMVLIFVGVYYRSCRAGADCKDVAIVTLGGICIGSVSLSPRPLLYGWLCLTGLLLVLDHFRMTGKGLWILPPLFLVWINLHGSWIYGMAILVLTVAAGLVQGEWGLVVAKRWNSVQLRKLTLALVASIIALFVNPFGYKEVLFPFTFFRVRGFMQYVEYWRPVDFSTWNGKLAMCLIFIVIATALFSRRRWRLDEVLLVAFALWSGLSHMRFLDLAAIIIVPILAPRLTLFPPYEPELDKHWLNAAIMAAVVGSVIFFFPTTAELRQKVDSEYPAAALAFMQRQHINGRVFHPAEFGGFIELNAPELKSFVDGRAIFVENAIFDDSFSALTMRKPFEVLDKYRIDYVLLEQTWPLTYLLAHSPSWHLVYSDKVAVLFERSPAAVGTETPSKPQSQ